MSPIVFLNSKNPTSIHHRPIEQHHFKWRELYIHKAEYKITVYETMIIAC